VDSGEPNYTEGESENDFRRGRIYLFSALPDRDEDGDGISTLNGDCDDTDEAVSPLSFEDCADDIDNDCDHEVNEGCDDGDDDDDTVDPGDDDDDDEEEGCSCESSLAGASPARAAGAAVLGGLWLGLAVYRRRIE